ncbi:polysaccharide deacetylase family protein [Geobacter sp.]|uniref:polysaccharide deacetylase family protein n=1 Tax=Geobacter sp. TaxID=46610 RepID=UPI0027BAA2D7|nr:polysaccharide deacetylase family protein [Geobacter sp.]
MTPPTIALKIDANTYVGTRDGIPRLVEILGRRGIRATFYFAMGPDNTAKAIRRIITQRGFLRAATRLGTPALYGMRTLLSGILIPSPLIGVKRADTIRQTVAAGHEVGTHGWDHVKWHDLLPWIPKNMLALELGRACALFEEVLGRRVKTVAAPGWQVSADSLEIQDAMYLAYASDCRGIAPFLPVIEGRRFATLQVPTTMPTLDELIVRREATRQNVAERLMTHLRPGLNVHTIQAEIEGGKMAHCFEEFLHRLQRIDARFVTLGEAAEEAQRAGAPRCELTMAELPGRPGKVALQGAEVSNGQRGRGGEHP